MEEDDTFSSSVAWEQPLEETTETTETTTINHQIDEPSSVNSTSNPIPSSSSASTSTNSNKNNIHSIKVLEPTTELEQTKDQFVSYLITAKTELNHFASKNPSSRRRFADFTFLREHLTRDFPAAVVPPLPEKHRMEYLTGDRFSPEFIERRRVDLQRFLERLARHPKLSRTELFQNFLESSEWNVYMHKRHAHPLDPEAPTGILDNLSDTLLNAFSRIRKTDERFLDLRVTLDQFEEGLSSIERLGTRSKTRLGDLSGDYEDLSSSIQGLGYLESGITEPLQRFERALLHFGSTIRETSTETTDPFLEHLHSLLAYSAAFRSVLKLRDQKQLDFEELTSYLSTAVGDRDRLAGGYGYGMGIGNYFKEKVDALRGGEVEGSREAKMARLDIRIKELQEAVLASQDILTSFNDEVLSELLVFQSAKRAEMKELLTGLCQGQIQMHKASMKAWDTTIPFIKSS